jgi:hypothetical protein
MSPCLGRRAAPASFPSPSPALRSPLTPALSSPSPPTRTSPSALWDIGKSITNPTPEDLVRSTKLGELHVWEKLSAIEANCAVEATLDACLARLTNKARERPLAGLSARIPSWLCMNAVGQQVVASWGNPLQPSGSALWGPGGWRGGAGGAAAAGAFDGGGGGGGGGGGAVAPAGAAAPAAVGSRSPVSPPAHPHHPVTGSPEAMAAAAAAAMAGQERVRYHYPGAGELGGLGPTAPGALLGAAHYPAVHTVLEEAGSPGGAAGLGRAGSWGSDAIADSVADFPADAAAPGGGGRGGGAAGAGPHHRAAHARRGSCGAPRGGGGGGGSDGGRSSGGGSARSASSGGRSGVAAEVLAQLDCCDPTAGLGLWSSLLPLSSASAALEAAAEGEGLDCIAP